MNIELLNIVLLLVAFEMGMKIVINLGALILGMIDGFLSTKKIDETQKG